jgi:23S rRNA pseudouridine1911/1915/1917 synthase
LGRAIEWSLSAGDPAARLDVALAANVAGLSRSAAQRLVREGFVKVNGKVVRRPSWEVGPDDRVSADAAILSRRPEALEGLSKDANDTHAPAPRDLKIAHEDEHIVVIDKPAGVPVHPGPGHPEDTLVDWLQAARPEVAGVGQPGRPGVVHRLDLDTSGLLIFAKTQQAYENLVRMIKSREVKRTYIALVSGRMDPAEGVIDAPVGRDPAKRTRQAVVTSGKPARTRYKVIKTIMPAPGSGRQLMSLLEITLETGRMHQIRVHLAAIGHPAVGDPVYGRRATKVADLSRQFLHAAALEFQHPVTGARLKLSSGLPDDLDRALQEIAKAGGG